MAITGHNRLSLRYQWQDPRNRTQVPLLLFSSMPVIQSTLGSE